MKLSGRWQELILIFVVSITIGLGTFFVYFTAGEKKYILYAAALLIGLLFLIHLFLVIFGQGLDQLLFPIAAMLSVLGLLGIYRINPELALKQWIWVMLGLISFVFIILFLKDYRKLEGYKFIFMLMSIFFLLVTAILGVTVGGSKAWLDIGGFRFQPAEIVKLLIIFFLASYLQETKEILKSNNQGLLMLAEPRAMTPIIIMATIALGLLAVQKDLGAALIFFGIFLVMLYTSTGRFTFIVIGLGVFIVGVFAAYYIFNHFRLRVLVWLNPWSRIDTGGYQIAQGLFALASGGIFGSGYGLGQPQVIPAAATDLIFAVLTEELGLLGGICIIILLLVLSFRGFRMAILADNEFGTLLATGITTLLALQSFIILSGVMKLLPLTGVTLPFVSYGGSSLVVSYILLGLVMNVGRRKKGLKNEA